MKSLLFKNYLGKEVVFNSDGYLNATKTGSLFDKPRVNNFLASKKTIAYMEAVAELRGLKISQLKYDVKGKGKEQGTYLHPYLAVFFARWLDVKFSAWCDMIIYGILTGELEVRHRKLQQDYDKLEDKHDKLFEELRLYQRPDEDQFLDL